ncbi:heme lyase CcmF/NrfE family subunit [Legionella longbeachae]|uniref:Cytochrome C-type biogenesis protein CcmF n=1 Tax=Legionella longbeachae serogroup 1 (strain NSW150) TaxID=661367 RepID=D3HIW9_LEGLN|nr:heme lyase CcmF/NrfE family subunit [Legionella longbeachae]VEE02857.1 cytochrome C-type biogenesis protein CcmF [Legionella oakridgensis]HBD7398032.1 heme lyase CcmF/NrfE family subunit [Legionella pneumophila]ARB90899.1 heme lyase CcmF/NrfE family subunit [Legionella longbeachae]ARM32669.1 heme lyase CcmF/NrfE family subunit [Legionella longbeachae]QIN32601.1 heme lyase CcmF/NrfE family subunit [Legionella longbeachae]
MIAELGLFSLILALIASIMLAVIPLAGVQLNRNDWMNAARVYAVCQFFFIALSYLMLTLCFLQDDFSVIYVVSNSSISLPWFYKLCAVWGGHEGSMLLWVLILGFWTLLVAFFSSGLDREMRTRVLVVLGWLSIGFILFLLITSNPFLRQFQVLNTQGRDLNPLLQDPGFLFHPPMLYMGYVGFSVAFAFAIAALWAGKVESSWSKWTRPWTLAAWCCLTAGITLGSWWAYRELGWGGWWFWDPVENASFMPWLVGTALLHSLAVTEQRQQFKAWTMLLAIAAFSLSLIGTFLVRSGVLTSVHAFAVDPQRGLYILGFLLFVIGGSLVLFLFRAQTLHSENNPSPFSRESALLLNNVFLVVIMLTVLMGTVYPLLIEGLGLGKLSVGAPYFNSVFVPLMVPMLLLMGVGIHLKWNKDNWRVVLKKFLGTAALSLLIPFVLLMGTKKFDASAYMGLCLSFWVILSTAQAAYKRVTERGLSHVGQAYWGMVLAHLGVAATVIGIAVSTAYGVEDDVQMAPGKKVYLLGYSIEFMHQEPLIGPNYKGTRAQFKISNNGKARVIYPEKRLYTVGQMAMTESAIDVTPFRDIYVALGEPLSNDSWSVRLYYKPFIRWIWFGGFMILAGGFLALTDKRYYQRRRSVVVGVEELSV